MIENLFLPCPFCGGSRIVQGSRYFAMCVDCGATGPERIGDKAGQAKLMKDWNTRPEYEPAVELAKRMKQERDCWITNAKELQKQVNGWEAERAQLKAKIV